MSDIMIPIYVKENLRSEFIEADERWSLARYLLHDDALDTVDRIAGLLLLLYAQPLARIATLTLDRLTQRITDQAVQLSLGSKPLVLPPPWMRSCWSWPTGATAVPWSAARWS